MTILIHLKVGQCCRELWLCVRGNSHCYVPILPADIDAASCCWDGWCWCYIFFGDAWEPCGCPVRGSSESGEGAAPCELSSRHLAIMLTIFEIASYIVVVTPFQCLWEVLRAECAALFHSGEHDGCSFAPFWTPLAPPLAQAMRRSSSSSDTRASSEGSTLASIEESATSASL